MALPLHPLHFTDQVDHLAPDVVVSLVGHGLHIGLLTGHHAQSRQHLPDGHGDHRATRHVGVPREGTVLALQLAQLLDSRREPVLDEVLVEEIAQPLLLLLLAVGIGHPRRLAQHDVLQFLILF